MHRDVDGVQVCLLDVLHALDVDVKDTDLVLGLDSLHCTFTEDRAKREGVRASSQSSGGLVCPPLTAGLHLTGLSCAQIVAGEESLLCSC